MHRFNPNMFSTLFFYANSVKLPAKRILNYLGHSRDTVKCRFSNLGWKAPQHLLGKFFLKKWGEVWTIFLKILTVTLLQLRASPTVLGMWSCTVKLNEGNPTYAGLAQKNGFGSAELCMLPWLVKGAAVLCTYRKECNKYDLPATQCFWLAIVMIGTGGLLLVVPHLFVVPVSVFQVGLQKRKKGWTKDRWLWERQRRKAKERPKDKQPTGTKKRERASPSLW